MWFFPFVAPLLAALDDVASAGERTRHDTALRTRLGLPMTLNRAPPVATRTYDRGRWVQHHEAMAVLRIGGTDLQLALRHLGEGKFTTAWADEAVPDRVWLRVPYASLDFSKELVARLLARMDNPHLPYIRQVGKTEDAALFVTKRYRMPLRRPDVSVEVWQQVKTLQRCHKRAFDGDVWQWGRSMNAVARERLMDCVKADPVFSAAPRLVEALEALHQAAYDYGDDAGFDSFPVRNLGTDEQGRLVLVDVVFNQQSLAGRR